MTPTAHICLTCQPPEIPALIDHPDVGAAIALLVIGVALLTIAGGLVWKWQRATLDQRSHCTSFKSSSWDIDTGLLVP